MQDYHEFLSEVLISEDMLQANGSVNWVHRSARIIRDKGPLILVCILRGGVLFLTDLIRKISIPHAIEFMGVSSYGVGGRESSGSVRLTLDLGVDIAGKTCAARRGYY